MSDKLKKLVNEELKKSLINEVEVVNNEFNGLLENYSSDNPLTYRKLFEDITNRSIHLNEKGISNDIIEEGIFDFFKNIGSSLGIGSIEEIKERLIRWILEKLNIEGKLKDILSISLANLKMEDYRKFLNPISNCEFIADKLADGILEFLMSEGLKKMNFGGGFISNTIRQAIAKALLENKDSIGQSIEDILIPPLCKKIKEFGSFEG